MSAYYDDPRVRPVSTDKYLIDVDGATWVVRNEFAEDVGHRPTSYATVWNVYGPDGNLRQDMSGRVSADNAIQSLIGDPR